jgi:putative acetyltransferase
LSRGVKYIFENDGKPAGMFKLIPQLHRTAHIAYLGGLAIHPQYYGKGLGQTMIAEILALGLQQGFLRIELSVATNNERAIRLYEKCGFKREGLLRKYSYLKKEDRYIDEIIMSWIDDKVLY